MSNTQVITIPEQTADDDAANLANLLRKKKNAVAQANFRARKEAYAASLERTVTRLETALVELQVSWRRCQEEISKLRRENDLLRMGLENGMSSGLSRAQRVRQGSHASLGPGPPLPHRLQVTPLPSHSDSPFSTLPLFTAPIFNAEKATIDSVHNNHLGEAFLPRFDHQLSRGLFLPAHQPNGLSSEMQANCEGTTTRYDTHQASIPAQCNTTSPLQRGQAASSFHYHLSAPGQGLQRDGPLSEVLIQRPMQSSNSDAIFRADLLDYNAERRTYTQVRKYCDEHEDESAQPSSKREMLPTATGLPIADISNIRSSACIGKGRIRTNPTVQQKRRRRPTKSAILADRPRG
ncbi:hypothetical protein CVT26_014690 [Gymnopilus dilepis]|uniref:BZIP domain-containing protein n=1 Tax=Gymnopilus dilepis TaxID=231916 RepID=A0A409WR41_9AGAR|nr:hypothetical protein CVT26_014690 [Gymnopilus dilepis]